MTFSIGRFQMDRNPSSMSQSGDDLDLEFDILVPDDLDVAKVYRQQLLDLVRNPDEPVTPIVWDGDPDLDGYYRINGVEVTPVQGYLDCTLMRVELSATRINQAFAEIVSVLSSRSTATHSVTDLALVWSPPGSWSNLLDTDLRARESCYLSGNTQQPDTAPIYLSIQPGNWYDGATVIEQYVGGTWFPISGTGDNVAPTTIRIGNELVRMTFEDATPLIMSCELFDGTNWLEFARMEATGYELSAIATVLRNAANTCTISLPLKRTSSPAASKQMRVSIRRGNRFFDCWIDDNTKFVAESTTAATSITGAVHATANDANGHRWVLGSDLNFTADTTNGGITLPSGGGSFFIGAELDGTSAWTGAGGADEDVTGVRDEWWCALSERLSVVNR